MMGFQTTDQGRFFYDFCLAKPVPILGADLLRRNASLPVAHRRPRIRHGLHHSPPVPPGRALLAHDIGPGA